MASDEKFEKVCKDLVNQIEWADFKDELGHELKNNQTYNHFKDIVLGNK